MKLLKPYFWPHGWWNRFRALLSLFLLGAAKLLTLVSPIFMGQTVDALSGTTTGKPEFPVWSIVWFVTFRLLTKVCTELQKVVYLKVKQQAYSQVAADTFKHLHSLSVHWHLNRKTGAVLKSMDRGLESADTIVTYLFFNLAPTLIELLVVCGIFLFAFKDGALAAIALVGVLGYGGITYKLTRWRRKLIQKTNALENKSQEIAVDSLINFETVKYFTNEEYEANRFAAAVQEYQLASLTTQTSLSVLNTLQTVISQACMLPCLLLTASRVAGGSLTVGDFTMTHIYLSQLFIPLSFLGSIYGAIIKAMTNMEHLASLLSLFPDVNDNPDAGPLTIDSGRIVFDDVSFSYPSQSEDQGVHNISFTIEPGTVTALVGTTGAGKSTIPRLLFRFYDVREGRILIDGQDITQVSQASLRRAIGIVPQDTVMFNDTIGSNIHYGNINKDVSAVQQAAAAAQIHSFVTTLGQGYETVVGERGLKLSGGERQRVAIARTILKDPRILVLDEATSALDTVTEKEIQKELHAVCAGRTTLVIAHRLSTVSEASQIIVLEEGRIAEKGTHQQLVATPNGIYRRLWQQQLDASSVESSPFPTMTMDDSGFSADSNTPMSDLNSPTTSKPAASPASLTESEMEDTSGRTSSML